MSVEPRARFDTHHVATLRASGATVVEVSVVAMPASPWLPASRVARLRIVAAGLPPLNARLKAGALRRLIEGLEQAERELGDDRDHERNPRDR